MGVGATAFAQLPGISPTPLKLRVSLGYGVSGEFRNRLGNTVHLEGPYLGLELPLTALFGTDVALGASVFGGGRSRSGNDSDADVYRFVVTARRQFGGGMFAKAGVGFAHSAPRGDFFASASGTVYTVGIGMPISGGFLRRVTPNLELNFFGSNHAQLGGLFFGITAGL